MSFIIIVLFIILFVHLKMRRQDVSSQLFMFIYYSLWFIVLFLSQFGLVGFDIPTVYSTIVLCLGVLFFSFGFYLVPINTSYTTFDKVKLKKSVDSLFSNFYFKIIIISLSIYILSLLYTYYRTVVIAQAMDLAEFRAMDREDVASLYGPLFAILKTFLLVWLIPVLRCLFCYGLVCNRSWLLIPMAVLLLGYESLGAGRFGYVRTFLPMILVIPLLLSDKNKLKISFRQSITFIIIIVGLYVLLSVITSLRMRVSDSVELSSETQDAFNEQLVSYAVGPTVAFSYALDHKYVEQIGGYKLGEITMYSLLWPLEILAYWSGFTDKVNPGRTSYSDYIQDNWISTSPKFSWNALYTWNLDFYCDYGLLGIIFFNLMFGFLFRQSLRLVYRHGTVWGFIICAWLSQIIIQSPIKLSDLSSFFVIICLVLLFFDYNENRRFMRGFRYHSVNLKQLV